MWQGSWRDEIWSRIDQADWDILVIGGGITGAGILREATRLGLRTLLVEGHDFAWGTSSRSSKLVHGGFRYLKQGKIRLTRASVHEREQLVQEGPGLIDPLGFLMSIYKGDFPGRLTMKFGLTVYDLLALRWQHKYYSPEDFRMLAPHLTGQNLECGFRYGDAQTDDARLVLRVIREAVADGGTALNYTVAEQLLLKNDPDTGQRIVNGARLHDLAGDRSCDVFARQVINATGAWADGLRRSAGQKSRLRPLRGSHLIFPAWRLPVAQAVSFWHPIDSRPVFIFPWEGVTLVGTTDVDHPFPLDQEPGIGPDEVAYLMAAVESQFPSLGLTLEDIISTYAGVRPVIGSGKDDPSEESRDHAIWEENGLLTVTGGKLTTFRLIAIDVLKTIRSRLPGIPQPNSRLPVLNPVDLSLINRLEQNPPVGNRPSAQSDRLQSTPLETQRRLVGYYAADAPALIAAAQEGELRPVPGTEILWAELRWAARAEGVLHLDDLLIRRVRLGLLLPKGGKDILPRVREICQPELGWDDNRWKAEEKAYLALWERSYSLPDRKAIPDWRALLAQAQRRRAELLPIRQRKIILTSSALTSGLLSLAIALGIFWIRRREAEIRESR